MNIKLLFTVIFLSLASLCQSQIFVGDRTDFRDETIYFLITTRFYDGDKTNNTACWDGNNSSDPAWRGDFKGLIEKLDYIKALGFTAIWITPIVENASGYDYHGYHALNFSKVDERYNSNDVDFQDVIHAVHSRGMKIILDIVLNHTGNFGEASLAPMFEKKGNLSTIECMKLSPNTKLSSDYNTLPSGSQYQARLALMKNTDNVNHDNNNFYHHFGNFNWDDLTSQWAQIAGDCVDLNTENPTVYKYLVNAYGQFIKMGVDGFRIDTGKHISRLVFNKVFNDAFLKIAKEAGKNDFFMFSEIATRVREVWNRGIPAISTPFYTWKDSKSYHWSDDASPYSQTAVFESNFNSAASSFVNQNSCIENYNDNTSTNTQPTSTNYKLIGNSYHAPDHSMHSGLNVIDFPMHWNFANAADAYNLALGTDKYYNDATYNVVYVDSHDYAPDGAPESERFAQPQDTWAENLSLMYTFRGIPCLYYGSEIEFKKGKPIDVGPNQPLINTGRAYYGGYITGDITVNDFGNYTNASGNVAVSLKHPLSLHIQRLNRIRHSIPALRKGQYSTDDISKSGVAAFKKRYTDSKTDSYVLVAISGGATFNNIPNGTYTDAITGDVKNVSNNTLSISFSGKGNMRVYVLSTSLTPAPGKIGTDGLYLYNTTPAGTNQGNYDGKEEALTDNPDTTPTPGTIGTITISVKPPSSWTSVNIWAWNAQDSSSNYTNGVWPGKTMTLNSKGYYTITLTDIDAARLGIIINNGEPGNPQQTVRLTASADICWDLSLLPDSNGNYTATESSTCGESVTPPKTYSYTIRAKVPSSWSSAGIWAWDENNVSVNFTGGIWPGKSMTLDSDGYYTFSLNNIAASRLGVVINNAASTNTAQTVDLTTDSDVCWDLSSSANTNGKYTASVNTSCGTSVTPPNTYSYVIRVKVPDSWSQASIWAWDLNNTSVNFTGGIWPGKSMTLGSDGYYYTMFSNIAAPELGVVINNGSTSDMKQTVDLTTDSDVCWNLSSSATSNGKYTATLSSNCYSSTETIYSDNTNQKLTIYPNPASNILWVSSSKEISSVSIYNLVGKKILKTAETSIKVSSLSAGSYVVKVVFSDNTTLIQKFIKR